MDNLEDIALSEISQMMVDCPDCGGVYYNEDYTCTFCWQTGGCGKINVLNFLKDRPHLLKTGEIE